MRRANGTKKNLVLTLWLLMPFAVLAGIIAIIFASYGKQKMDARPIGQGAGETGGANALGELLAGNNPIEQERIARELREGRLIDPLDWPHGIKLTLDREPDRSGSDRVLILWAGAGEPKIKMICGAMGLGSTTVSKADLDRVFTEGLPGAGLYLARTKEFVLNDGKVIDEGRELPRIALPLVPSEETVVGEPIEIRVIELLNE